MATEATSAHRGGVAIFYHEAEHFAVKELLLHGPNIISFHLVTGRCRWYVVGCYIDPINASNIESVSAVIRDQPYGADLLVAGNLNSNLAEPEGTPQGGATADEIAAAGLLDMGMHFLQRHKTWFQNRRTWRM